MAEGLCRALLTSAGVEGVEVLSAGTVASGGEPATFFAVLAAAERGADISGHHGRPLTPALVRQADLVLTMSRSHHGTVVSLEPEAADRVFVLPAFGPGADPHAPDVADPIGQDFEAYERTAHELYTHLQRILPEIRRRGQARRASTPPHSSTGPDPAGPRRE